MKKIITILALFFTFNIAIATSSNYVITAIQQQQLTPEQALQKLIQGNERYRTQNLREFNQEKVLKKITQGQHPFAFIFNCVDSRSVPELLFDQTLGNIFVGRIAGNVADQNILGSMEFAVKFSGTKLIVVMGHTSCGAIYGACTQLKAGNLTHLLQKIQPAVMAVKKEEGKQFNCSSSKTIDAIAKQNVLDQMHYIINNSAIISKLIEEKKILLVGAMNNLANGKVTFFKLNGKPIQ